MLSIFELATILLTLSAILGWINRKYLPTPHMIGLLLMSVFASLILLAIDLALPDKHLFEELTGGLRRIDFADVVMNGMLAFLLFAGSLHVDLAKLRSRATAVAVLAVFGTLLSTVIVGGAIWQAGRLIDLQLPLAWAFVFGALISPTDPVAVMGTLKNVDVPASLEVEMQGESLFNDGVGVVLYTILLLFATGNGEHMSASSIGELLLLEMGGSLVLGVVTGYVGYRAMRAIDDYPVEVLITIALVMSTYALAQRLHMSGPLAVVAAGLLIGHRAPQDAMSERTQSYVFSLWTLIDEILNSVLFLLIGLEVLLLDFDPRALLLAAIAIPIVLGARLTAVGVPALLWRSSKLFSLRNVPFLTWAGVRGGISVALALSIPDDPAKSTILVATYVIVLFSIIVQGSTLAMVARRTIATDAPVG
ncbi:MULTISPECIES: cation:proton antiporter [Methylosinus]|uniref:Sodium:proton antiporter n=1 Tax=Methylosinus trichosporium (strain ATCC 35070 / NCIMB 11131 / UNIQEM 75 / OB3b) TaxID=595536 RepID=A0A2D2D346_METT3|nr:MULTISPECIES: sodium:proton antiporter [Methylosinus]ATQ69420.1 sodium:proton antiporter [Methylosinus trichosporium OB3b]OBS52929.1 sodium:proton antiporter [Methylosinus sp. 3S-1]